MSMVYSDYCDDIYSNLLALKDSSKPITDHAEFGDLV
jgi:hypothetical protein